MAKRVLGLALNGGAPFAADEPLALERVQGSSAAHAPSRARARPTQNTFPSTAAAWRIAFSSGASPSRRAAMMPWTSRAAAAPPSSLARGRAPDELLGVERVAASPLEQRLLRLARRAPAARGATDQSRCLLVGERRETREGRRVQLSAAPAGASLEELGPRRRDHEQRHVRDPFDELVDEVEQAVVGPVEVLEDEDEGAPLGQRLEEAAPGGERLAAPVDARARSRPRARRAAGGSLPTHARRPGRRRALRRRRAHLLGRVVRRRRCSRMPGLRLHDLAERPAT